MSFHRSVNFSKERREHGIRIIRGEGILTDTRISDNARLLFAVGILIANDLGVIKQADLNEAVTNRTVIAAAQAMLEAAAA